MALAPSADLDTSVDLVATLLGAQAPALADLPFRPHASGWDNDT